MKRMRNKADTLLGRRASNSLPALDVDGTIHRQLG
jgi:hypothetical protein